MIRRITEPKDIDVSRFEMPWSLYPYSNYVKYGLNNDKFIVYSLGHNIFTSLEDTIQVCSDNLDDKECRELADFVKANKIRMVNGPSNSLKKICDELQYGVLKYGYLFQLGCFEVDNNIVIEHSSKEDEFQNIAKLVCDANSSNTSYYGLQQFFNQIYSRYQDGYCRNIVVKDDDKIIGHVATYAENEKYGVIGGLAVDTQFRGQGIAKSLMSFLTKELSQENKRVYAFCYNETMEGFYRKHSVNEFQYSKILLK